MAEKTVLTKYLNRNHSICWACTISIILFLLFLCIVFVNCIRRGSLGYDGGWNLEVAKNYAEYGTYAVSFPAPIEFHYPITTRQTVLIPAAVFIKLFGLSINTVLLTSTLYCILWLVLMFELLRGGYKKIIVKLCDGETTKRNGFEYLLAFFSVLLIWIQINAFCAA